MLGAWLKQHREDRGLTQVEVADHLGMGFTAISAIEVGRSSVPPENYETLAELLGIDRVEFGRTMLRYSNPWAYAMIFGTDDDPDLATDMAELPRRAKTTRRSPITK